MELHSANQIALRRVIAVLVPRDGIARTLSHPGEWLRLADPDGPSHADASPPQWISRRQTDAERVAHATAQHFAKEFAAEHERRIRSETDRLNRWLAVRADEICDPAVSTTLDLFGSESAAPTWQQPRSPAERLAGFTLDDGTASPRRREANGALELFRRRDADCRQRVTLSPPIVRQLGLLTILPRDRA